MAWSDSPSRREDRPPTGGRGRDVLAAQAVWLEQRQPGYLVAALGRPGRAEWRELALEIERYRRARAITTRACSLGAPPENADAVTEWSQLAGRIASYQGVNQVG